VEKAMRILEALAVEDGPHRLMDVAERAGVPRSTAYRVLATLGAEGFAQNCGDGRYGIGTRLGGLGARIVRMLSAGVGPTLQELQRGAGGNTVHLAVRVGDHAVYLHKVDSDKPYEMRSRVGNQLRLHCTAIGKAILAALPDDEVRRISGRTGLPRRMPHTLTTTEALLANLASVRARGWALDDEENVTRVRCVGAVVLNHRGEPIGAVSVSGLSFDMARAQVARLAPMVVRAAREVSAALGARA
jgi:IclR family acetate operon transcriptional repressor